MIGLIVDKVPADVATNPIAERGLAKKFLKYLCHAAAATLARQQFRIDNYFNGILCNWTSGIQ